MYDDFDSSFDENKEENDFFPIVSIEEALDGIEESLPQKLPVIPLRSNVFFPNIVTPINVSREGSIEALKKAEKGNKQILLLTQKDPDEDAPEASDLFEIGVLGRIIKLIQLDEKHFTAIIQGRRKAKVDTLKRRGNKITAEVTYLEKDEKGTGLEFDIYISQIREIASKIIDVSHNIPQEANMILKNMENTLQLLHFIASNLNCEVVQKQKILKEFKAIPKAEAILKQLNKEYQMLLLKTEIQDRVKVDLDKQQRDYFLNQQIKTIQDELGDRSNLNDLDLLGERAALKKWSEKTRSIFDKELSKLSRMNPAFADYSIGLNYLELMLDLPWNHVSDDNFDLNEAEDILNKDHFGLEKVKNRILEYLAVLKLKGDLKSPILCFVGPPGVGKTSLGKSIANALNRAYSRISLGGLHDESEIRGHRKTYIGAMPGRILQSLKKAGTSNPVFILDEIDKVGSSFRGDPSSALLEVLDPEQNGSFYDNYLEMEYDLSKVMFVATANSMSSIQPALLDRMEIIQLSGYAIEEKVEIAKRHLIPKLREEHGLKAAQIKLSDNAIITLIDEYTREAGVRNLGRQIASIMRYVAKRVASEEKYSPSISPKKVREILGLKKFDRELYKRKHPAGVAVGLAWTSVGGEILFIETSLSKGKGKLTLTGNLGDVMKESASTALSLIKSKAKSLKIDEDVFENTNVHVHVPEGAIPKDGPSAGITMVTALVSAFKGKAVKSHLAMTGEITLRGAVLPVGGIKEKILAAKRSGIKEIILCEMNRKDVNEINESYLEGLTFHYVDSIDEVIDIAIGK